MLQNDDSLTATVTTRVVPLISVISLYTNKSEMACNRDLKIPRFLRGKQRSTPAYEYGYEQFARIRTPKTGILTSLMYSEKEREEDVITGFEYFQYLQQCDTCTLFLIDCSVITVTLGPPQ